MTEPVERKHVCEHCESAISDEELDQFVAEYLANLKAEQEQMANRKRLMNLKHEYSEQVMVEKESVKSGNDMGDAVFGSSGSPVPQALLGKMEDDPRWLVMSKKFDGDLASAAIEIFGLPLTPHMVELLLAAQDSKARLAVNNEKGTGGTLHVALLTILFVLLKPKGEVRIICDGYASNFSVINHVNYLMHHLMPDYQWLLDHLYAGGYPERRSSAALFDRIGAVFVRAGYEERLACCGADDQLWIVNNAILLSPKALAVITDSLCCQGDAKLVVFAGGNEGHAILATPEDVGGKLLSTDVLACAVNAIPAMVNEKSRFVITCIFGHSDRCESIINISRVWGCGASQRSFTSELLAFSELDAVGFAQKIIEVATRLGESAVVVIKADGWGSAVHDLVKSELANSVQAVRWGMSCGNVIERRIFANQKAKAMIMARSLIMSGQMRIDDSAATSLEAASVEYLVNGHNAYASLAPEDNLSHNRIDSYFLITLADTDFTLDDAVSMGADYLNSLKNAHGFKYVNFKTTESPYLAESAKVNLISALSVTE